VPVPLPLNGNGAGGQGILLIAARITTGAVLAGYTVIVTLALALQAFIIGYG